jgi:tetratricopeptide (TPR) repeat protein
VGRHLVAAERALEEDDPDRAHEHTKVARRFAARIGVVREAAGIVAYRAGHFSEALSDLRAARRLTGSDAYLPVMADCERGLGRPERAIDLVRSPEAERLDRAGRIELTIVESGARRDLGQHDAAVITLQRLPELRDPQPRPWSARLAFAYADALADAGQAEAATEWFSRAMAFDEDGETDAAERYAELTGAVIEDLEEDYEDEDAVVDGGAAAESDAAAVESEEAEDAAALAEAGDVLDDEPETAELPEDDSAGVSDAEDSAGVSGAEDSAGVPDDEAVVDDAEAGVPEPVAETSTPGITPAFIEPDFGDRLDQDDVPQQNRPKTDE